jgi:hypothetical protein
MHVYIPHCRDGGGGGGGLRYILHTSKQLLLHIGYDTHIYTIPSLFTNFDISYYYIYLACFTDWGEGGGMHRSLPHISMHA